MAGPAADLERSTADLGWPAPVPDAARSWQQPRGGNRRFHRGAHRDRCNCRPIHLPEPAAGSRAAMSARSSVCARPFAAANLRGKPNASPRRDAWPWRDPCRECRSHAITGILEFHPHRPSRRQLRRATLRPSSWAARPGEAPRSGTASSSTPRPTRSASRLTRSRCWTFRT